MRFDVRFAKSLILVAVLTFVGVLFAKSSADMKFAKTNLQVGTKKITVEVADTPDKQAHGLMFRKSMPTDEGMIFIFNDEEERAFWMKNTFIPLSIAYANAKGVIVDIQDMSPVVSEMESRPPAYPSKAPAMYALEMNQGWFSKNKIKVGDRLILLKASQK